ncbi:hypothetical protein Tco_1236250 [Tanacetum coccineum]
MVGDSTYYTERLMLVQQEEARIEITAEQHDFLAYASDEERKDKEFNANYVAFSRGDIEHQSVNNEETNVYIEFLLNNFKINLDKCFTVNQNDKDEIKRLTTELA